MLKVLKPEAQKVQSAIEKTFIISELLLATI